MESFKCERYVSNKVKHAFTYDGTILFWDIYSREEKTHDHTTTYTRMFKAYLFTIAQMEITQLSVNRRVNKQIMGYLFNEIAVIKQNKPPIHTTTWVIFKIMLSKIRKTQNFTYSVIPFK